MLRRWALPLLALLIVACAQTPQTSGGEKHEGLQDTSAAGAKYTLLHAWAPW